ncbi:MAG: histidine triad nucleotide-binding protein [Actinomycetota bacterium]|nr:histidine triad nucleotide-binding protein [Actinomycetota bacterium]
MDTAQDCIFCKIVTRQSPARIVYEDSLFIAIEDANPQAPVHILVLPKKHIPEIQYITDEDKELIKRWFWVAVEIASERGLDKTGYRTVINNGTGGGQTVQHIHIHLLSGRPFSWPPG